MFDDFLYHLLTTMNFHEHFDLTLNWPQFALTLNRLGVYNAPLIDAILMQRSRFGHFGEDCFAFLESLQKNRLVKAEFQNLLPDLNRISHNNQFRLFVYGDNGVTIPLLVKINIRSRTFAPFEDDETNSIESIRCDDNHRL